MYKLLKNPNTNEVNMVLLDKENIHTYIPLAPENTDYQQFVRDIKNGVQLNDAEGNPITGAALTTFISTLP
jgi:N-acetylglucosamine-6-phosphate deacetylase